MRIALLIDCDNVSSSAVEGVLAELAKHGTVNVRHAHGDWKSTYLNGWVEKLHANAIRPLQQFAYTSGKNATDAAMIIDGMDILYSKNVDGFALMTSDSGFTPLVMRILESGLYACDACSAQCCEACPETLVQIDDSFVGPWAVAGRILRFSKI